MVIEKILKVESSDPKAAELRERLAALQAKARASEQKPAAPEVQVAANAAAPAQEIPATAPVTPKPSTKHDENIAALKDASFGEQKAFVQKRDPTIRLQEERTIALVMAQLGELTKVVSEANKKQREADAKQLQLEKGLESMKDKHEELLQKMNSIDSRLEKFMGLYELITNQYNPFAAEGGGIPAAVQAAVRAAPQPTAPRAPPASAPAPVPVAPSAQASTPPQTPKGASGQFAVEDTLTQEKNVVTIKDEDASAANASFKRVEQMLADLQKQHTSAQDAAAQAPLATTDVPAPLASELHSLLGAFEERFSARLDSTLQAKLHERFTALQERLEVEIRDALHDEIEAVQRDDKELQNELAELQAMVQARERGVERSALEDEIALLQRQLGSVRDEIKAIPPNMYFRLADGHVLKDLTDLRDALEQMPDELFAQHVQAGRNDFAQWVEHAMAMPTLADLLRQAHTARDMRERIVLHDGEDD